MGSINGVGVLRGQRHIYPSKTDPSTLQVQCSPQAFQQPVYNKCKVRWSRVLRRPLSSQWFFVWDIKLSPHLAVHNTGISLLWFASSFWVFFFFLSIYWTIERFLHPPLESICARPCGGCVIGTVVGQSEDRKLPAKLDLSINNQRSSTRFCGKFCCGTVVILFVFIFTVGISAGIIFERSLNIPWKVSPLWKSFVWNIVFQRFDFKSFGRVVSVNSFDFASDKPAANASVLKNFWSRKRIVFLSTQNSFSSQWS